jgi:hypothetical protein
MNKYGESDATQYINFFRTFEAQDFSSEAQTLEV